MTKPVRSVDWTRVLDDIACALAGPTLQPDGQERIGVHRLAQELGVARGTLRGWLDGSEPRHSDGEQLLDRWRVLTGKPREFAPTVARTLSAASLRERQ